MKGVYLSVAQLAVEHAVDVDGVGCEGCAATFFLILIQSIKNLQQKNLTDFFAVFKGTGSVTVAIDILFLLNMPFFVYKMYFLFRSDMKSKLIFLSARPAPHLVLIVHCTMYTTCTSKSRSIEKPKIRYVFNPTTIPIFCALFGISCLK